MFMETSTPNIHLDIQGLVGVVPSHFRQIILYITFT